MAFNLERRRRARLSRQAVHGTGDSWSEVSGRSPYTTSPLVNAVPQFGGNERGDLGSCGNNTNDEASEKSYKGWATDEDFDPERRKDKINEKLKRKMMPSEDRRYILRIRLREGQDVGGLMGMFEKGKAHHDGRTIAVEFDSFEDAVRHQQMVAGSIIETV